MRLRARPVPVLGDMSSGVVAGATIMTKRCCCCRPLQRSFQKLFLPGVFLVCVLPDSKEKTIVQSRRDQWYATLRYTEEP